MRHFVSMLGSSVQPEHLLTDRIFATAQRSGSAPYLSSFLSPTPVLQAKQFSKNGKPHSSRDQLAGDEGVGGTTKISTSSERSASSVTLPISVFSNLERPRVPMTSRSGRSSETAWEMTSIGPPSSRRKDHPEPSSLLATRKATNSSIADCRSSVMYLSIVAGSFPSTSIRPLAIAVNA